MVDRAADDDDDEYIWEGGCAREGKGQRAL